MSDVLSDGQKELISLGQEAEVFLNSPLGKFLQDRATLDIEHAKDALLGTDPSDAKKIVKLQNLAMRHVDFQQWIRDLIEAGNLTYEEYISEAE